MAYAVMGRFQRHAYTASNASSSTAAAWVVPTRSQLLMVWQAGRVNFASTTVVGAWSVFVNNVATTLSSVPVPAVSSALGTVGVQNTSAEPTTPTYLNRGDVVSVTGSSLVTSTWTFVVREY